MSTPPSPRRLVTTIIFLMTSTRGGITFSVGLVAGVLVSLLRLDDPRPVPLGSLRGPARTGRRVSGAALMGMEGGTLALELFCGPGGDCDGDACRLRPVTRASAIAEVGLFGFLRQLMGGFQPD